MAALPLLHLTHRSRLWVQWFDRHGIEAATAYQGHRFDSFAMLVSATVAGLGLALLPSCLIEDQLRSGQLVALSDRALTTDQAHYSVVPDGKIGNPLVTEFQAWLVREGQAMAQGPHPVIRRP